MAFIDYYKILGVDRNIPQKDVRDAYRRRAKQFHPDLHPNDPKAKAKFQALNEAYDVIGPNMISMASNGGRLMPLSSRLRAGSKAATTVAVRLSRTSTSVLLAMKVVSPASSKTCSAEPQHTLQAGARAHPGLAEHIPER